MDTDADFEAIWNEHHREQLRGVVAFDETITARTFARPEEAAPPPPSFSPPPLPPISIDRGAVEGVVDPGAAEGRDLQVIGTLGEGGMGLVLLARQRSLARDVAVKVLRPAAATGEAALALLREAVVMGGVEHPNIVPVHALGRDAEGRPVLVMKRVEGTSWCALLEDAAHPAWTPLLDAHGDRATANLEVLMRVADAAHFAHSRGVVHRDIKPENVMVGAFGEVYLVDWGIAARLGHERAAGETPGMRGTPAFMAPEMLDGDVSRVDARTDVYLLGATLHNVLTGTLRHVGSTLHAVLFAAHASRPVAYGPEVPAELAALCNEATDPDPARRPESALAFRRRLAEYRRHRASLTLTAAATARLAALHDLVERGGDRAADAPRVQRLGVECRFGFAQALEVWADNAQARAGLERALRLLLRHELDRENLDAARALAGELGEADPAVEARLAALEAALAVRREREAAAVREAHETDLSKGREGRPRFILAVLAGVATIAAVQRVVLPRRVAHTVGALVVTNVGMLALLVVTVVAGRRALLVTRVSRQVTALAVLCVAATLVDRGLAYAAGASEVAPVLRADLVILSAALGIGAATIRPWLGWMAACTLVGAALVTVAPGRATDWYTLATGGVLLLMLHFGWARATPEGHG